MVVKCSKCIDYFRLQKNRWNLISDLKAKNEGMLHANLKNQMCNMFRELGQKNFPDWNIKVETEVPIEGIGKVDVLAQINEVTIAIECGNTNPKKILKLEEKFDLVLHIPFCYTQNVIDINTEEINHQIFATMIHNDLVSTHRKGILLEKPEKDRPICLEEGECSLPSGRDGFPDEAKQLAGLTTKRSKEK